MNKKKTDLSWFKGVLLFICAGIIPFIVKMIDVPTRLSEYGTVRSARVIRDAFSYYKMTILIILGVILAIYSVMDAHIDDLKKSIKKPVFFLPAAFIGLSLLSALLSHNKDVAFYGATERYEGFWVWAVYILLFVSTFTYIKNKTPLYIVLGGLACGAILTGTVGALQFLGKDPYETELFTKLIMGEYYEEGKTLGIRFTSVFSTLYNPNCVGIYTGMLCPFFLLTGAFAPVKSWYKYALIAVGALLFVNLFGCESLGGFIGLAAGLAFSLLIAVIYFAKSSEKAKMIAPAAIVVCFLSALAFIMTGGSKIAQKIDVIRTAVSDPEYIENPFFFEDLKLEDNTAYIKIKTGTILIPDNNGEWSVKFIPEGESEPYDIEAKPVTAKKDIYLSSYSCDIPGLIESGVNVVGDGVIEFAGGDGKTSSTSFYFKLDGAAMTVLDMFGNTVDINKEYKSIGFKGLERLGSNRGYIWSRSIPLIANNIIVGAGPDCYVFEFPQQDIISKLNYLGNPNIIIDKPHNFYLQIAINSGLISLVVLLALFMMYIINTLKAVFVTDDGYFMLGLRLGALAGVIGYLAAVTTTDSVVSVSPVFWILLGLGFAVNKKLAD